VAILAGHPTMVDHVEAELGVSGGQGEESGGETGVKDEFEHASGRQGGRVVTYCPDVNTTPLAVRMFSKSIWVESITAIGVDRTNA